MKEECIIVLQPLDERGEPKGEPLKIRGPAVLTPGKEKVLIKERESGNAYQLHKLVVVTTKKSEALPGYYGLVTPLIIDQQPNGVRLLYGGYPRYPISVRSEGEEAQIMEWRKEIGKGKCVDVKFLYAYMEVEKEDNMPVISRNVNARIRICVEILKEEAKNLYQK